MSEVRNEWFLGLLMTTVGMMLMLALIVDSQGTSPHWMGEKYWITIILFECALGIHLIGAYVLANMLSHFLTEERR